MKFLNLLCGHVLNFVPKCICSIVFQLRNVAFCILFPCSCGYNQEVPNSVQPPYTDGVLGLGTGKSSIVGQLGEMGLTRNVVGHCLSSQGGGFLFFGSDLVPSSGIIWTPILSTSEE